MTRLEDDLRTTLQDRATDAAPLPDLWSSVTAGVRRDQRRRRTLATVAAAIVVGAAGITISLLAHERPHPSPPVVQQSDGWAPPSWPSPTFPMEPSWLPHHAGTPSIAQFGPNAHLEYREGDSVLSAEIGPFQADWETEAEHTSQTTVDGRPAELHTSSQYDGSGPHDQYAGVRWQRPDGQWITVLSWGNRSKDDVLHFAASLHDAAPGIPAGKPPFTLATIPPGLTLAHQSDGVMCLAAPADAAQGRQTSPTTLCVTGEDAGDLDQEPPMEDVTVNGRHAIYYDELHQIVINWSAGENVVVSWNPDTLPLTRDEAIRFATGIS